MTPLGVRCAEIVHQRRVVDALFIHTDSGAGAGARRLDDVQTGVAAALYSRAETQRRQEVGELPGTREERGVVTVESHDIVAAFGDLLLDLGQ